MATVVTPEEEEHAASVLAALSGIERPSRGDGRIHNINISSSDGRRININASPSGGRPRMFVNRNNTGTQTGNNGGRHQMPMMGPGGPMLPPLEPQPVPNQTASDAVDGKKEDGDPKDMKKYECGICFGKFMYSLLTYPLIVCVIERYKVLINVFAYNSTLKRILGLSCRMWLCVMSSTLLWSVPEKSTNP